VASILFLAGLGHGPARASDTPPDSTSRFVAQALASLTPEEQKDDDRKVRALRRYVYRNLPIAGSEQAWITDEPVVNARSIDDAIKLFRKDDKGVWCQAAAVILSRVYEAAGYRSWVISFGDPKYLTHTTTLVAIGTRLYLEDAYFNFAITNKRGTPIVYDQVLRLLARKLPPQVAQDIDVREGLFSSVEEAKRWTSEAYLNQLSCLPANRHSGLVRCKFVMTLDRFEATYQTATVSTDEIHRWLQSEGWQPSFMYLMMYPLWDKRPFDMQAAPDFVSVQFRAKQVIANTLVAEKKKKEAEAATVPKPVVLQ
jgi:hypothetical protein